MPRRCRSNSPIARRPPPPLHTALPRITPHQHLRLLRDQNIVLLAIIDVVRQHRWVEYATANNPTIFHQATLRDCLGLGHVILQIKFWNNGILQLLRRECNDDGILIVPHLSAALWSMET